MNQTEYYPLYYFSSELLKVSLSIAERIEEPLCTKALIIIAKTYNKLGCRDRFLEIIDLILEQLDSIENYKERIYILFEVERLYSDPYRALEIIDLITEYINFLESDCYLADIYRGIAHIYMWLGRYNKAQSILQDALEGIKVLKDRKKLDHTLIKFQDCLADPGLDIQTLFNLAIEYVDYSYGYQARINILSSWCLAFAKAGFHQKALEIYFIIQKYDCEPDEWILQSSLTDSLIYYYIHETNKVEQIKNILKANINSYRFFKICQKAVECYVRIRNFDIAWKIIQIIQNKSSSEDNLDKAEVLLAIAQKYFAVKRIDEALFILEFAVYIAELIDDEEDRDFILRQIAQIYITNNYLHLAQEFVPIEILEAEQYRQEESLEERIDKSILAAYSLIKNNKYSEAIKNNFKNIKFQEELLDYIINEYYKYKKLIFHREAKETIEQAIKLIILLNHEIIDTGLTNVDNFQDLSRTVFLLSEVVDIYLENISYGQTEQLLKQVETISKKIKTAIKQTSNNSENVKKLYNKHLKHNHKLLIDNLYARYLDLKNYRQVLSLLNEEYSSYKKVQQLTELAIKYAESPSPIEIETKMILNQLI